MIMYVSSVAKQYSVCGSIYKQADSLNSPTASSIPLESYVYGKRNWHLFTITDINNLN